MLGVESASHIFGPERGEPIPVLDDNRGHVRVPKEGEKLPPLPVESTPNLGHYRVDGVPFLDTEQE